MTVWKLDIPFCAASTQLYLFSHTAFLTLVENL
jgi:hypothetical protein